MAIEKTQISHTTLSADLAVIKNFIDTNFSDWFDSVALSESGDTLTLTAGGSTVAFIATTNDILTVTVTLPNSVSKSVTTTASASSDKWYPVEIAKTSCGFAIKLFDLYHDSSTEKTATRYKIFFTKTNSDSICMLFSGTRDNTYNYCVSLAQSTAFGGIEGLNEVGKYMTTYTPFVCQASYEYAPNLYYLTFNQYKGVDCTLVDDNGTKYLSNGYVALKE